MKPSQSNEEERVALINRAINEGNYKSGHLSQSTKEEIATLLFQSYKDMRDILDLCPIHFETDKDMAFYLTWELFTASLPIILQPVIFAKLKRRNPLESPPEKAPEKEDE